MRGQAITGDVWDEGQRVQLATLTARQSHVMHPSESLAGYLGKMPKGGLVYLPEGTWYLNADYTLLHDDVMVAGAGGKTIIRIQGAAVLTIQGARACFKDLVLEGQTGRTLASYLVMVTGVEARLVRVLMRQCTGGVDFAATAKYGLALSCGATGRPAGAAPGIRTRAEFVNVLDSYIPGAGGGSIDLTVDAAKCVAIGNRCPGGDVLIDAGSTNLGNYM